MARRHQGYPDSPAVIPASNLPGFDATWPNGDVLSQCWCERRLVRVTRDDMLAGRTATCGHPACTPALVESAS